MLVSREKKILKLLLKKGCIMTTLEMAIRLGVSTRTIKADIKKINEDLKGKDCLIETKAGVGLWLSCTSDSEKYLQKILFDKTDFSVMSPEARNYYIAVRLFQEMEFISIEKVSCDMYVSKSTVMNNFNELEKFLRDYEIILIRKAKYGIKAQGSESNIRKAYVAALGKFMGSLGKDISVRAAPFFEEMDLDPLHAILCAVEIRTDMLFADISYYEIFLQMAVTIYRVKKCFVIEENKQQIEDQVYKTYESDMRHQLWDEIQKAYHISLEDDDLNYILEYVYSAKQQLDITKELNKANSCNDIPKFYNLILKILNEAEELYHIDLREDEELLNVLVQHFQRMLRRSQNNIYMDNPFLETIKSNMVYEYEIAAYITAKVKETFHIDVRENEISFVALYIGAICERMITRQLSKRQSVILTCVIGTGASQFLQAKMERLFPNIVIRQVVPHNKINMIELHRGELIISTTPLTIEGIDTLCVSPVLDTYDIRLIRNYLEQKKISGESHGVLGSRLARLLDSRITILQCDCKTKEEVINLLGMRMVNEKFVDEGYIASVLERECLSDTSVGSNFAIPHAFGGHVVTSGIGLMTLKKPIPWGENKIQVVLMLALDYRTKENLHAVFTEIMDWMNDSGNVDQLIKAKKYSNLRFLYENGMDTDELRRNGRRTFSTI